MTAEAYLAKAVAKYSNFPNPASCLRLVSAILAEIDEEWLTGRTYLNFEGAT